MSRTSQNRASPSTAPIPIRLFPLLDGRAGLLIVRGTDESCDRQLMRHGTSYRPVLSSHCAFARADDSSSALEPFAYRMRIGLAGPSRCRCEMRSPCVYQEALGSALRPTTPSVPRNFLQTPPPASLIFQNNSTAPPRPLREPPFGCPAYSLPCGSSSVLLRM